MFNVEFSGNSRWSHCCIIAFRAAGILASYIYNGLHPLPQGQHPDVLHCLNYAASMYFQRTLLPPYHHILRLLFVYCICSFVALVAFSWIETYVVIQKDCYNIGVGFSQNLKHGFPCIVNVSKLDPKCAVNH